MKKIAQMLKSKKGQGLVEYAILIGLIAVLSIVVIGQIGTKVNTSFNKVNTNFNP